MSKTKKWLIAITTLSLVFLGIFFAVRAKLNNICIQYNTEGLRSGSCTKGAPFFCRTTYYSPSCKGCQDAQGCGF